jgi:hypothetical protein
MGKPVSWWSGAGGSQVPFAQVELKPPPYMACERVIMALTSCYGIACVQVLGRWHDASTGGHGRGLHGIAQQAACSGVLGHN